MPYLKVNDINLFYESTGDGEPLLFIHGLGSNTHGWERQVPYFAQFYRVITLDVRGHGQSDKPTATYSISLFADDIIAFIKAMDIAPVTAIGISMGGMIAFQIGVTAPELLKSMVIVNAGPVFRVQGLHDHLMFWKRLLIVKLLGMRKTGEFIGGNLFPKPEQAYLRETLVDSWAKNDKRAYLNSTRSLVNWDVTDSLGKITCPVLVVAADQDYTPVSVKEAYLAKIPNAELAVVSDSRHATPVEKPDEFNQILHTFLKHQS